MERVFAWRKTSATDLPDCLKLHPAKNGSEIVGSARTASAWHQLFQMNHATRSTVVEMRTGNKVEIVGFGLASFVKKNFAEAELKNPRPGLNARIIESIAAGKPLEPDAERRSACPPRTCLPAASCRLPLLPDPLRNGGCVGSLAYRRPPLLHGRRSLRSLAPRQPWQRLEPRSGTPRGQHREHEHRSALHRRRALPSSSDSAI